MITDLRGAFWAPRAAILGSASKVYDRIMRNLFAKGEQGFWYDPNDLDEAKLSFRKNLINYSNDLTKTGWNPVAARAAIETVTTPDGLVAVSKFIELASTNQHSFTNILAVNKIAGLDYTLSFYAKAGERKILGVGNAGFADAGNAWQSAIFDLEKGTIEGEFGGLNPTITSVGGGWYKITAKFKVLSTAANSLFRIWMSDGAYTQTPSYTGDGTSGLYVYNFQVEKGTNATEYQPITDFNTEFLKAFPNHALFQDQFGITPVTAAEQPLGLILDKSKGLVLGPNIANPTNVIGAGIGGNEFKSVTVSTAATVGKWYKVTYRVDNYAGTGNVGFATASFGPQLNAVTTTASNGFVSFIAQALASNLIVYTRNTNNADFLDMSIQEIQGNHAYQLTSSKRPVLGRHPITGARNIMPYSDDPMNSVWAFTGGTKTGGQLDSSGGYSAVKLKGPTTGAPSVSNLVANKTDKYTYTLRIKGDGSAVANLLVRNNTKNLNYMIGRLTFSTGVITGAGWTAKPVGNGFFECSYTTPEVVTTGDVMFCYYGETSIAFDTFGVIVERHQLEAGSVATNFQKTRTLYDITEVGSPDVYYMAFDGVDDFLMTGPFALPVPFSTMHTFATTKLAVSTQPVLAANTGGYLLTSSPNSASIQQTGGNPQINVARSPKTTITQRNDANGVYLKSNLAESLKTDLVLTNPYSATNAKFIGAFSDVGTTFSGFNYYGGFAVNRSINSVEETTLRNEFNKKIGV